MVYKKFNFDAYPPHARDLKTYAWKPIVIAVSSTDLKTYAWIPIVIAVSHAVIPKYSHQNAFLRLAPNTSPVVNDEYKLIPD